MKKKIIIISLVAILLLAIGGFIYISKTKNKENEELNSNLTLITGEEFKTKIENKDSFILIITQTDCAHCEAFLPVFKQILLDYDLKAFQIDQATLSTSELSYLKSIITINGTPTTTFFKDGEELSAMNRLIGDRGR